MPRSQTAGPDWNDLYETASDQGGLFTSIQAAKAGYSAPLLTYYVHSGKAIRVARGVYRLVHFPPGDNEDLLAAWLWSDRAGVISHQTALSLHGLSDVLPAQIHLTVPSSWRRRKPPLGVELHYDVVPPADRSWIGNLATTTVERTLHDCALAGLSPELLRQATKQALKRGLAARADLGEVRRALKPFGGLPR